MTDLRQLIIRGALFSSKFLSELNAGESEVSDTTSDLELSRFKQDLLDIIEKFIIDENPNEAQTISQLIVPLLHLLGWHDILPEQNLSPKGRSEVPDGLMFQSKERLETAQKLKNQWARYQYGLAFIEMKRWNLPIARESQYEPTGTSPSTQMLRYVRRVDDVTNGALRWGILTNGAKWRLYYAGADSISEQFFEFDLTHLFIIDKTDDEISVEINPETEPWLRTFHSVFRKQAFLPAGPGTTSTFHDQVIARSKYYEAQVSQSISQKVFDTVFPTLVREFGKQASNYSKKAIKEATLVFLYRLLFILYAEDRSLLPVMERGYKFYSFRDSIRNPLGDILRERVALSPSTFRFWNIYTDLCRLLDWGESIIGLPQYDGGLFDQHTFPLLNEIKLSDPIMVTILAPLSFEQVDSELKYINYSDLSVQHLGSIYENLLEYEVKEIDGALQVVPNTFSRKVSGSYYTPDDLVKLVIKETIDPLIDKFKLDFSKALEGLKSGTDSALTKFNKLVEFDVADAILNLRICDPAMGSGHFLVSLVDILADEITNAIGETLDQIPESWGVYPSPVSEKINVTREKIIANAKSNNWEYDLERLEDRQIIRRLVLKRCVYGVDKNPMAVELAKVSLWLHTLTFGAPLSFLDHHLRCGDSLFGVWVNKAQEKANKLGSPLLWSKHMDNAYQATEKIQKMEAIADVEISEISISKKHFGSSIKLTKPLDSILKLIYALDWIEIDTKTKKAAVKSFFDGQFGDPVSIAQGKTNVKGKSEDSECFKEILKEVNEIVDQEKFLNWQLAFPGVWEDWEKSELTGGFDAIIGNPPWDRLKLQEVEWFNQRFPEVAKLTRASDRKSAIQQLIMSNSESALEYTDASERYSATRRIARTSGDYPLLSGGDINLYSLFVERAFNLSHPTGMIGLIIPSGISQDKTAAEFFQSVTQNGNLRKYYDFENRSGANNSKYFKDVAGRFKFCVFIASRAPSTSPTRCAFFVKSISDLDDDTNVLEFNVSDFKRFNPNTGTMPIFRSSRDARLLAQMYRNAAPLVDRSTEHIAKVWPVNYRTMFHLTNDSHLFKTQKELEEEKAYFVQGNAFQRGADRWLPLYVGKMIHQFDHRAAHVDVNKDNLHYATLSGLISEEQKTDVGFAPIPQYWIPEEEIDKTLNVSWMIAFRSITNVSNVRTFIASAIPKSGAGNSAPLMVWDRDRSPIEQSVLLLGNLGTLPFDYATRQKVQGTNLNWYIVEQLPVIRPETFKDTYFGTKTATQIVSEIVLELVYTANDMKPFAKDMGYVTELNEVKPPFVWNDQRRLVLRAKLDAVFFHLYGITDIADIEYIYSTFPILEREVEKEYGDKQLSFKLCCDYFNALSAGEPDADVRIRTKR